MSDWNTEFIKVPTTLLRMEVLEAGKGPLMVMLHGFPEMAESWQHQIKYFSQKGRHVIAPNMRGYGNTDRPRRGYDVDTLSDDILGIIDHYNAEKAVIVAHDWGGVVAWHFAYRHPNRLKALIILNAPHPVKFEYELRHNILQMLKSWYILAFQIPFLPEWLISRNKSRIIGYSIMRTAIRKEAFTEEDKQKYSQNMSTPGALKAGIEYYRRAFRNSLKLRKFYIGKKITSPTLVIWAQQDYFLGPKLAQGLDEYIDAKLEVAPIENCGHWVNREAPEEVNSAMEKFLLLL